LNSVFRWLTKPATTLSGPQRRRAHLLAWLLLFLILLSIATLFVLVVDPSGTSHRTTYVRLILGLTALLTIAYGLNRAGHYFIAAGLTIACAVMGPWGSLILDPSILQGDFVPLTYVALTILLSSILLPPTITIVLAALQLAALALMPLFSTATTAINWPSLVVMVFFTSVLSIVVNIVNQHDLEQIEHQTRQLAHSNELIYALAHVTTHIEKMLSQEEVIRTLGEELNKIDLTCLMAVYDQDRSFFTLNYTSVKSNVLEQMENSIGFPLREFSFSLEKLKSTLKIEDILHPAVISNPEDEIQLLFTQPREKDISKILQMVGIEREIELLRLPLIFEESLHGILWIWGKGVKKTDLPIMSVLAKQIGILLERARLFQEVQSLALTDSLTGLQNRRSLFELGGIEFSRSQRMKRPFCCMMLDIDHFKQINDNYGHPVGDQVLREFAARCKSSVREVDLIGRYGGEELVIFLPETDSETAMQIAERLRASVEGTPIDVSDQELNVTVSIGVSRKDENTLQLETLIARADQAMYIAKHKGRNRVAISV
jgi:diguanylate cyclase (GGDEF)-like protein